MKTQGSQEQLLGQLETGAMMTGGMEETGSSAQGDKGAAQKQRREPRGLEEGLKGMGSRVGSRQNWQRSGWELEWHQQCFCYLQGTSKWRRKPRMWQRDSTQGTRGEKQGPSNHRSSQRRKWGRQGGTGRDSGDWGWGLRSGGWMWGTEGQAEWDGEPES